MIVIYDNPDALSKAETQIILAKTEYEYQRFAVQGQDATRVSSPAKIAFRTR